MALVHIFELGPGRLVVYNNLWRMALSKGRSEEDFDDDRKPLVTPVAVQIVICGSTNQTHVNTPRCLTQHCCQNQS